MYQLKSDILIHLVLVKVMSNFVVVLGGIYDVIRPG